ncbi:MAG: lipoyl(octanoyl) transferase LipB [Candidatus Abyssubacteria bacterium]
MSLNIDSGNRTCQVIDLGLCSYAKAYALQKEIVESKQKGSDSDTLLLVEHPPIITFGRRGRQENLRISPQQLESMGIQVLHIDRGGDVTYHGPGQLVGYPIIDLKAHKRDVDWILRNMEAALIASLKRMGVNAYAERGYTGVWTAEGKIAAIGIGIKGWVTFHGFALNVAPMMHHFDLIIPCGIKGRPVTSLSAVLGREPAMDEVKRHVADAFCETFALKRLDGCAM